MLVITDRKSTRKDLSKIINDCFKAGVKAIQLREKDLPSNRLLALANKLKKTTKSKLIINDRLDIALLSSSDGVHSPEKGIDAKYIKKYAKNLLAGRSVHSKEQAIRAERGGFDYLLFGPVFRTPTKIKYGAPQGLKKLKQICSAVNIPVFAVGGITPRRVKKCLTAGAYGVASISAVMKSANIRKTISEFKGVLEGL